jgi:hypothetical protein
MVSLCLCIHVAVFPFNILEIRWIFMKFGIKIIPLQSAPPLYFLICTISNINMAAVRTSKVAGIFVECKATKWQQHEIYI